jgi:flagellar operon protein
MNVAELYRGLTSITPETGTNRAPSTVERRPAGEPSEFERLLKGNLSPNPTSKVSLSQHAETRIKSRSIPWSAALEKRISGGIDAAEKKGSKEALILADDVAVIANVKTRTIVTAMDRNHMKEKVFTNIDSAVLV